MKVTKIKIEMSTEIAEIFKIQLLAEFSGRAFFFDLLKKISVPDDGVRSTLAGRISSTTS